jgi:mannose-6-phosphate isomerase-like protein (cupin superfamily)
MKKAALGFGILFVISSLSAYAESPTPKEATDITKADIDEVLKHAPPAVDQTLRVVDLGKYNLAVGVIHRGPTKPGEPAGGISHSDTTETYIILSGGGTLVTGGTIPNGKPAPPNSDVVKVLNGPSTGGRIEGGRSRTVAPGDVIIIPFGVPHGWTDITDHVDYLSVRPDHNHVLPAGYVNPAIKDKK